MKTSKPLAIALAALTALALLTGAVAAPILCRPFYYAHIGPLKLEERTGLTEGEIKTAFDEMLDYCLGAEEFSTGVLQWSESGKSHFTDVRGLFLLDLRALGVSLALLAWTLFRLLSRNAPRRRAENAKFLKLIGPLLRWFHLRRTIYRDKEHCYFKCPHCGQQLRVPRGKGKITVTCRSCGASFEEKS